MKKMILEDCGLDSKMEQAIPDFYHSRPLKTGDRVRIQMCASENFRFTPSPSKIYRNTAAIVLNLKETIIAEHPANALDEHQQYRFRIYTVVLCDGSVTDINDFALVPAKREKRGRPTKPKALAEDFQVVVSWSACAWHSFQKQPPLRPKSILPVKRGGK
jgi:hypothetical protein